LDEQQPKVLYANLPVVWMYAVNKNNQKKGGKAFENYLPLLQCTRARTQAHAHTDTHARTRAHTHTHARAHAHARTHAHAHAHAHAHTHTHTHTHTRVRQTIPARSFGSLIPRPWYSQQK
jgi:hypothetical protein